jgi:hypothetical protein
VAAAEDTMLVHGASITGGCGAEMSADRMAPVQKSMPRCHTGAK